MVVNKAQGTNSVTSMSKGFQNIGFSNEYERSETIQNQEYQRHADIAQQARRDKARLQGGGFGPSSSLEMPVYETGGMWSDMFNFQSGGATTSPEFLENQISYRSATAPVGVVGNEWYGNRQGIVGGMVMGPLGDSKQSNNNNNNNTDNRDSIAQNQNHQISSLNADSAAAMQLFLMNPQPRSPSSPTPPPPPSSSSTPLHLLQLQGFHHHHPTTNPTPFSNPPPSHFQWGSSSTKIGSENQNQGLSLTLSTSLQHLEAAKAEEFRMGEENMFYYDQGSGTSSTSSAAAFQLKNLPTHHPILNQNQNHHHQVVGMRSSMGGVTLLRNSKYARAAQELLEEFCSVGRGHLKNTRSLGRQNSNLNSGGTGGNGSSSSKDQPPLSSSDKIDYQRKKTKLISMLDEVDRRYNHYCEQMQAVVNSFDSVMGFGAATPYTALAQKAMSRHFRCLKDAITSQLKQTCELLGDKDSVSGVTKGETPRLKILEQSLRQQRAFQQMGMMEQEAWRPQRGLPERSVNILRAWLFEHFLHPYPSDADKHLLARQTGLSRNQVSNWFINARVRLWKPMVEEMYQQEAKDEDGYEDERESNQTNSNAAAQTPMPSTTTTTQAVSTATTTSATTTTAGKRSHNNDQDNDSSLNAINTQCFSENQAIQITTTSQHPDMSSFAEASHFGVDDPSGHLGGIIGVDYRTTGANADMASTVVRFGTSMGDVSLTLGLRHAGNLPEKNQFSVRDFGGC